MATTQLVITDNKPSNRVDAADPVFLFGNLKSYQLDFDFTHNNALEFLCYQIARKPKDLINHVRRIHYCFRENLNDALYAAIIDLFSVLKGKEAAKFGFRMYRGVKSKLTENQRAELEKLLSGSFIKLNEWPLTRYSVLSRGMQGVAVIYQSGKATSSHSAKTKDPLSLAQDYIEFSQLTEAREVLETALLETPERVDLAMELIQLYKSTRDIENFELFYNKISELGSSLQESWDDLNAYMANIK